MAGINRMVGTPWHIERYERQKDDPRRHRSRCKHFERNKKSCYKRNGKCIGSAHCLEYEEIVCNKQVEFCAKNPKAQKEVKTTVQEKFCKIGEKVKHVKYGEGEVIAMDGKAVTIRFSNNRETKFDIQACIKNGYIKKVY